MDDYALSPLFVEAAAANLGDLVHEFADILTEAEPAEHLFPLKAKDQSLLRSIGCPSKEDSKVWRSLFLPSYMRPAGRNTLLWDIVGKDSKHRDALFRGDAWFNESSTCLLYTSPSPRD